jgi:hypothetical protein
MPRCEPEPAIARVRTKMISDTLSFETTCVGSLVEFECRYTSADGAPQAPTAPVYPQTGAVLFGCTGAPVVRRLISQQQQLWIDDVKHLLCDS